MNAATLGMLHSDVLERIYMFLNLSDIFKLYDMNRNLREAVLADRRRLRSPFRRVSFFFLNEYKGINSGEGVSDCNLTFILKYLIVFGETTRSLELILSDIYEDEIRIVFQYIFRYCTTLETLIFTNLTDNLDQVIDGQMLSVYELCFENCEVRGKLCDLTDIFPNIQEVEFGQTYFERAPRDFAGFPPMLLIPLSERRPISGGSEDLPWYD